MLLRYTLMFLFVFLQNSSSASEPLVIPLQGAHCGEDPNCFNRIHHDIPMHIRADAGQTIVFHTRNTLDANIRPDNKVSNDRLEQVPGSTVHPITGPVYILGAKAGDTLAVTIHAVKPADYGFTLILPSGFISDLFPKARYQVLWKLNDTYAESPSLPGIRIPNASFPGIVTVLPDKELNQRMLLREEQLLAAGGAVSVPEPVNASPAQVCGESGTHVSECMRTVPPREHGGNVDIRYLASGVTLYLPCYVDGCGLGIGDAHYAQGDGEVSGTAIEMDAVVSVSTKIIKQGNGLKGLYYEGQAKLLDIPSRRFFATTGMPFKLSGEVPPDMRYLESDKIAPLTGLSKDISLAARNALIEMLNYLVSNKGLTREQAYVVMSVAVDLRIGQLVDAPNVNVSAILPLDIFVEDID
jgi:formamidase